MKTKAEMKETYNGELAKLMECDFMQTSKDANCTVETLVTTLVMNLRTLHWAMAPSERRKPKKKMR